MLRWLQGSIEILAIKLFFFLKYSDSNTEESGRSLIRNNVIFSRDHRGKCPNNFRLEKEHKKKVTINLRCPVIKSFIESFTSLWVHFVYNRNS